MIILELIYVWALLEGQWVKPTNSLFAQGPAFIEFFSRKAKVTQICTVWFYNQREVNTVSAQFLVFIYLGLRERGFQRNFSLLFIKMIGRWYFTRRGHWNQADIIVMGRDSLPFYKRTGVCGIGIPASLWKDIGNLACYSDSEKTLYKPRLQHQKNSQ